MKIFYIVTNPISPVIESQVLERVISLKDRGVDVSVLFLLQGQHYLEYIRGKSPQSKLLEEIDVKFFPTINRGSKIGNVWLTLILLSQILKAKKEKVILHCRGLGSTASALLSRSILPKKVRVIYDIRGDSFSEKSFYNSSQKLLTSIKERELKAIQKSDKILAVSHRLIQTLQIRYNHDFSAEVFYCVAKYSLFAFQKEERERLRKALNLSNKIVFVYAGSLGRWHNIEQILKLIKALSIKRDDIHLLLLTKDKELGLKKIQEYDVAKVSTLLSVEYKDIGKYLSVGDIALLFRDNHPLNIVASPTKFAEYSLNGLGTIITDAIGDYSTMVQQSGYGLCLDSSADLTTDTKQVCRYLDNVDIHGNIARSEQGDIFKEKLSIESTLDNLIAIYKKL